LSTRKSISQTCTAILFVLLPLQWSISTSGKVSHPGDLDLLTSAVQPVPPAIVPPATQAAAPAKPTTQVGQKSFSRLPFAKEIGLAAKNNGIDALLLTAVVKTESRFDPSAVSPRGAVGLMQVRPDQGEQEDPQKLLDPAHNLERGASYLRSMLDQFGGDLRLALAAYNAGPNAVRRFGGTPPYAETEAFVTRVLSSYVELHGSYEPAVQAAGS
jgi:soluble lytic murein transglycosylase-like protein